MIGGLSKLKVMWRWGRKSARTRLNGGSVDDHTSCSRVCLYAACGRQAVRPYYGMTGLTIPTTEGNIPITILTMALAEGF